MSEWQPAIIRNVHGLSNPNGNPSPDRVEIIPCGLEVREGLAVTERRSKGCNIDTVQLYKTRRGDILCEHEVSTD
jgi:hypothetical protein